MRSKLAFFALVLAAVTVTSGCAIRGNGKSIAYVIDGALIVAGAGMIADAQEDCSSPPSGSAIDDFGNSLGDGLCEIGESIGSAIGATVLLGGVIGLITNIAINAKPSREKERTPSSGVDFSAYAGPPGADPCGAVVAEWRDERNYRTKTIMYRNMSTTCQSRVTRR